MDENFYKKYVIGDKMIIDLNFTIGYKCPACDHFHLESLSVFDISCSKPFVLKCECGESELEISRNSNVYILNVPCFICGIMHTYKITKRGLLLKKSPLIFDCKFSGYDICCIGEGSAVEKWINDYAIELDKIIEDDFEDFFVDDLIVFETIEKIKSLEEIGKLYCECGSRKIEIELLSESVELQCMLCGAKMKIQTATEEQLKKTLNYEQIVLGGNNNNNGKKSKLKLVTSNNNL